MNKIIIGKVPERDRDHALEIAFEHGITVNGDNPQRVIDRMVRALTGCHPDGRESKEYHDWVWAFTYRGVRWDTGKRVVAKMNERAVLSYRANQPEYDDDGLEIKTTGHDDSPFGTRNFIIGVNREIKGGN